MPQIPGYPVLTAPASNDLLVAVDVSDTTQSPAGTTKQVQLGSLPFNSLLAATITAGYTLVNGTGTILSWTAPGDGLLHRVNLWGDVNVSSGTTGGLIQIHLTDPGGTAGTLQMDAGTHAGTGFFVSASRNLLIQAGSTLVISQDSAMTAGAAKFYAEIWGS